MTQDWIDSLLNVTVSALREQGDVISASGGRGQTCRRCLAEIETEGFWWSLVTKITTPAPKQWRFWFWKGRSSKCESCGSIKKALVGVFSGYCNLHSWHRQTLLTCLVGTGSSSPLHYQVFSISIGQCSVFPNVWLSRGCGDNWAMGRDLLSPHLTCFMAHNYKHKHFVSHSSD